MAKLEGIIFKTFENYVVLRGFAPIKDLAAISHRPDSYQRNANKQHKKEIIEFLNSGEFIYFPEVTLACRVDRYREFASNIGVEAAVDRDDAQFVKGLKVLSERLPYDGYRARHANLTKTTNEDLVRVDGNHRLEPFDDGNDDIWKECKANKNQLEQLIVPFTVVFSEKEFGDKFEAGIFHNINFKQLPLREEASLKIISDLNAFDDKEGLGEAYPLALELIEDVKRGKYNSIYWLKSGLDTAESYFRTTCLRIVQLLISQKEKVNDQLQKAQGEIVEGKKHIAEQENKIKGLKQNISDKSEEIAKLEIENPEFEKMSKYKSSVREFEDLKQSLNLLNNELDMLQQKQKHLKYKEISLNDYLAKSTDKNSILSSLTALINVYNELGKYYGNIAYLCALVHYSLLDKGQLDSFISWSKKNGITRIMEPDDLSKDASVNLITMFNQIHQSKKNKIFISMQFGDSQSELIFEKIVRAIERFNSLHKDINLSVTPIRIDRNVESNTSSIPDDIKDAIKSCSLIIADLSSANINVYHEIGYAMGIAESQHMTPNIILLYKENTEHNKENKDVDKFVGFNLRNLSQLRFRNYDQLVDGLIERLEKHYEV